MTWYTSKCEKPCGVYHKRASSQTRNYAENLNHTDTTNTKIHRAYDGTTSNVTFHSLWLLMISASNTSERNTLITSSQASRKANINSPKIGKATYWNYKAGYVDISMPGYIKKKLHEYGHIFPKRIQTCPYSPEPKAYGAKAQAPYHPMIPNHSTREEHSRSNKSLAVSCITHGQSAVQY